MTNESIDLNDPTDVAAIEQGVAVIELLEMIANDADVDGIKFTETDATTVLAMLTDDAYLKAVMAKVDLTN